MIRRVDVSAWLDRGPTDTGELVLHAARHPAYQAIALRIHRAAIGLGCDPNTAITAVMLIALSWFVTEPCMAASVSPGAAEIDGLRARVSELEAQLATAREALA